MAMFLGLLLLSASPRKMQVNYSLLLYELLFFPYYFLFLKFGRFTFIDFLVDVMDYSMSKM